MKIDIDIKTILQGTPSYMVGDCILDYDSVVVGDIEMDGKHCTLNAVFDLENGVKELVVSDENDIIISAKTRVYLVKQTQASDDYYDKTIYVCSTKDQAIKYCQKLNKEYGRGCEFDKNWNFIYKKNSDSCHYYNWESIEIDEPLA